MNIVMTGASGFIGSRLVQRLLQSGHRVIALVRSEDRCPRGAEAAIGDLSHPTALDCLPDAVDALIHLAQSEHHRNFPERATDIFKINVESTARLLGFAHESGARSFVLASSGSVYSGTTGAHAALQPDSFYAATKLAAEALLWPYGTLFATTALRLFTPYGRGQRGRLMPSLVERVREGKPVSLDGDAGGLRLAAAHVDDVATVFQVAVENEWRGVFDVAAPEIVSLQDIAMEVGRQLGRAPLFERSGRPEPPALIPDLEPLGRVFPLQMFRDLSNGLREMCE